MLELSFLRRTMGLENGQCQNLSGFEGDLSEPSATIKMILNEIQEEERKKVLQNDAKQSEANEV
jgi:hypothetical protein